MKLSPNFSESLRPGCGIGSGVTSIPDNAPMTPAEEASHELKPLTEQQKLFVRFYLKSFSPSKAAAAAGYSDTSCKSYCYDLLRLPEIQAEVARLLDKAGLTEQRIKTELAEIALGMDAADYEGVLSGKSLKDLRASGIDTRQIRKVKATRKFHHVAGESVEFEQVELELLDRQRALEKLADIRGLVTRKQEISGPGGGPIEIRENVSEDELLRRAHAARPDERFLGGQPQPAPAPEDGEDVLS